MDMINRAALSLLMEPTVLVALAGMTIFLGICVRIGFQDWCGANHIKMTPEDRDRLMNARGRIFMDGEDGPVELTDYFTEIRVSGAPMEPGQSPAYRDNPAGRHDGEDHGETQRETESLRADKPRARSYIY